MKKSILAIATGLTLMISSCQNSPTKTEEQPKLTSETKPVNDSTFLMGSWVQPIPGSEKEVQGFTLKNDGSAQSINMATMLYKNWRYEPGKLTLVSESIGNKTSSIDTITYQILKMTDKELELKEGAGEYIDKYTKQ